MLIKIGSAYKPFFMILLMKNNMLRQILVVSFSLVTLLIEYEIRHQYERWKKKNLVIFFCIEP